MNSKICDSNLPLEGYFSYKTPCNFATLWARHCMFITDEYPFWKLQIARNAIYYFLFSHQKEYDNYL